MVESRSSCLEYSRESGKGIEKTLLEDPFKGITNGCLVRIEDGPRLLVGKDALVINRDLLALNASDGMVEEYKVLVDVLVDGKRLKLWIDWVSRIVG